MQKLLALATLTFVLGLAACNDDDEKKSSDLSKTEAKAKISAFNSSATEDLQDLADAPGLAALTDLSQLTSSDDPFGGRSATDKKKVKAFLQQKGHAFRAIVDRRYAASGRAKGEEPFDFDANTGIYVWDADTEEFTKTGESDIIKIQFPTEGSATNNAELQLKAYEEVETFDADFGETYYEPSVLKAALIVDSSEAASLSMNIEWDESDFPLTADFTAKVGPFSATLSFDVSASDKNTLSASLLHDQKTLFTTSVTVLYESSAKNEEDIKTVSGNVQLVDLNIEGSIDVAGMDADASQEVDLNKYVTLKVTTEGKKVGDIVFETETVDGQESSVAYIKYADGTQENLEDLLKPVTDELDKIEEDING
jgi:predicted 3-demethylubiquinone-9 3-methyltransferase (glyoxalase superfamily)